MNESINLIHSEFAIRIYFVCHCRMETFLKNYRGKHYSEGYGVTFVNKQNYIPLKISNECDPEIYSKIQK